MIVDLFYIKPDSQFSSYVKQWADRNGIATEDYDIRMNDHIADGYLLINQNQDIDREMDDLHTLFDQKHIPTQKVDINGTLQVAVSSTNLWLNSNKCKNVLILGADNLVENENLERFFNRLEESIAKAL